MVAIVCSLDSMCTNSIGWIVWLQGNWGQWSFLLSLFSPIIFLNQSHQPSTSKVLPSLIISWSTVFLQIFTSITSHPRFSSKILPALTIVKKHVNNMQTFIWKVKFFFLFFTSTLIYPRTKQIQKEWCKFGSLVWIIASANTKNTRTLTAQDFIQHVIIFAAFPEDYSSTANRGKHIEIK